MGQSPGGKRKETKNVKYGNIPKYQPRKLFDIQGSPPSSGAMHANKEELRHKHLEACMDEQGGPGQTQAEKEGLQEVEARTGSLGEIQ